MKGVDNRHDAVHLHGMPQDGPTARPLPSERQVEAAARAWMMWQFPGRAWDDAIPAMQDKFRDGARRALVAAMAEGGQIV